MSMALPPLFLIIGGVTGFVLSSAFGLQGWTGYGVVGIFAILGYACWHWSDLPTTAGFGAPNGPGPSPPKWVNPELGTAIYEHGGQWRAVHRESELESIADDPQDADDQLRKKLESNGWIDDVGVER